MDVLAGLVPIAQLSTPGALVLVLWLQFRAVSSGDWVSRREMDYVRADRDARLAEKDHIIDVWTKAAETERAGREIATEHARELLEGFRTLNDMAEAWRALADRVSEGDSRVET